MLMVPREGFLMYPESPRLSDELVQRDFERAGEVQQWLIRQL
jgi:hypothetical protein